MDFMRRVQWFNLAVLTVTPSIAFYGCLTTEVRHKTLMLCIWYYLFGMIGITAGYHRLWSHKSYNASLPLKVFLVLGGSSAVQGSVLWWSRTHRAHHRYTDTSRDPYAVERGFFHAHIGWTLFKSDLPKGRVEITDLRKDPVVVWQHRYYHLIGLVMGFIMPAMIPGLCWGDWSGGLYFATMARLTAVHHCTFCINSVAHWLGDTPYDDKHSARDHLISAVLTLGEGYHNFHHQFPSDYRNAVHWTGFDPTKWFIWSCRTLGLASNLRRFSANEIAKGAFTMQIKALKRQQDSMRWPPSLAALPAWTMSEGEIGTPRILCIIKGVVHDVSAFATEHPGGEAVIRVAAGKDVTNLFFGEIYTHSNAAHNLLAMMRLATLDSNEVTSPIDLIPVSQRLRIVSGLGRKRGPD